MRDPRHPVFAGCDAGHAVGPDVVATVRPNALLSLWRGYADPAPEARPRPRFDPMRGPTRGIARDAQFARSTTRPGSPRRRSDPRVRVPLQSAHSEAVVAPLEMPVPEWMQDSPIGSVLPLDAAGATRPATAL